MKKRDDILSGVVDGDPPMPYGYIPARAPRCPHKACRRARSCISPEPEPEPEWKPEWGPRPRSKAYYLLCPMLSEDEHERWRVRVLKSMRKRFGSLCTEPPAMLAGAFEELDRRGDPPPERGGGKPRVIW